MSSDPPYDEVPWVERILLQSMRYRLRPPARRCRVGRA